MTIKLTLLRILDISTSWNDIHHQLSKPDFIKKNFTGKLFEEFCKYYYLTEPSVRSEYKNVWLFSEVPHLVRKKLNIGTRDYGIDLILEGHDNDFSSVQCKFRSDQNAPVSWTKDNLASFFAESEKSKYIIVFTNASGVDSYSLTKNRGRIKVVTLGDLLNLSQSTINQIKNRIKGKKITAPVKKPRDYQQNAINAVINGFKQHDRGQLIIPCGAGKTLIALWIKGALMAKHTLVLVPSLALLRQIKNEWNSNNNDYIPYICVCSEKDIDKENDSLVVTIFEIPGRVTTDPKEVRKFLSHNKKSIIYATYQSLEVICKVAKDLNFAFDLAICDEAHKTAGHRSNKFCLIHEEENIKIKKRLYMTATPRVVSNRLKNEWKNKEITYLYDMSNRNIFGREFYRMSFKEAIDRKILVDYRIVAIGVSNREVEEMIKQRKYTSEHETTADEIANNYALEKFSREHGTAHAITFHSTVRKAKDFQKRHKEIFPDIRAYHVNGTLTTNERVVIMNEFKSSEYAVMTNARCLTEGIDIPAIDTVFFCDPKTSKVDIVQATGRALRRAHNKEKQLGYIVVPIYHADEEKLEEEIESGLFKNLISVVRALSSQDERLEEEITQIKSAKGKSPIISQHISTNLACNLIIPYNFTAQIKDNLFYQEISTIRLGWLPFEEAREFVHSLGLKKGDDWLIYSKNGKRPENIPSNPDKAYKSTGWVSMGDWLGTDYIDTKKRAYWPHGKAREFIRKLKLQTGEDFQLFCESGEKPSEIPKAPDQVYKQNGWVSMGDWLGTNFIHTHKRSYLPFEEARLIIHKFKIQTQEKYREFCKNGDNPENIPASPATVYKDTGWVSWPDWLGTNFVHTHKRIYLSFEEARLIIHKFKIQTGKEYHSFCKSGDKPENIPSNPDKTYKDKGWVSMGDWLGTNNKSSFDYEFLLFEKARKFVRDLGLETRNDWLNYCKSGKRPENIPSNPQRTYKDKGWISWTDWLGKQEENDS
ncbi:DEAD/DEAH box helicase family protein [Rickettsiella endosymbiont of Dermanyssus gallinae]|uniref:DEAD/DEAH box helicase family protein n=1 Tax=Rickettsiella endosymbiont of Dermanyssus gallinae TaxID=2856608 RepID=UPI001C529F44|nr:DEAD/DEAH box helicase family protein [Rickettsiella endosymbiont of Dermanyssus gallinae]